MTKIKGLILGVASLLSLTSLAQDPTQWNSGWSPYFRHINAVEILPNGKFVIAGGWEANDAITSIFTSTDTAANWNIELDMVNAILQDIDFPNGVTGYAVGWSGNLWKSTDQGDNWTQMTIPGNPGTRNFNGCYFFNESTGVIVGGNESNDAIQTILKTTDGGSNWSIISDNLAPWLRAVHFADATTGYAVGDAGTILKSTNSGDSWTPLTLSGGVSFRKYNGVFFTDANNGVAVGGWPDNDSIQTIIRTTDGGANWSVIRDNIGSMLNAVYFYSSNEGYAVGDDGVVLFTNDGGATWTDQTLLIASNNILFGNRDVNFSSPYFGLIGGSNGKTMWYNDQNVTLPVGELNAPVTVLNANSVHIQGWVNDNGLAATLELEYGTTLAFGANVPLFPGTTSASGVEAVAGTLNGLTPDQVYFARMKMTNTLGTNYSNVISFYTGLSNIPNFNFENWDEFTYDVLNDWFNTGGIAQTTSHDGSLALNLSQDANGELGAVLYGIPGMSGLEGGIPYTDRPDSLTFWANYNIAVNDSALVLLQLKQNSTPIADSIYKIGGNSGGWVYKSFKINYTSGVDPDSLIMAFTNTNVFGGFNEPTSTISIDNVILKKDGQTMQQVPNNEMESWSTNTRYKATSWVSNDDQNSQQPYVVERVTDSYSGSYAIKLKNYDGQGNSNYGRLKTGTDLNNWGPVFEINHNHDTLYGYYKFSPDNGDTLWVRVNMFEQGAQMGWGQFYETQNVSNYTRFAVPVQYGMGVADSCMIEISFYKNNGMNNPGAATFALIDNLSFDAVMLPSQSVGIDEIKITKSANLYPNPTEGPITIEFDYNVEGTVKVAIVDLSGSILNESELVALNNQIKMNMDSLESGYYFIIVAEGNSMYSFKTLVK